MSKIKIILILTMLLCGLLSRQAALQMELDLEIVAKASLLVLKTALEIAIALRTKALAKLVFITFRDNAISDYTQNKN
jgi:hypothetical protein